MAKKDIVILNDGETFTDIDGCLVMIGIGDGRLGESIPVKTLLDFWQKHHTLEAAE
jgi:hypothetical protein